MHEGLPDLGPDFDDEEEDQDIKELIEGRSKGKGEKNS